MYDCPTRGSSAPARAASSMARPMMTGFLGGLNPTALIAGVIVLSGFMRR